MSTPAKVDELIGLTEQLAGAIEADVKTLKSERPAALKTDDNDRAILMLLYGKATAEFKQTGKPAQLPAPTAKRLKVATERLHKALKEQARLLTRFRHVTEGIVKAVAEGVAARQAPGLYGKTGAYAASSAPNRSALALNQAI